MMHYSLNSTKRLIDLVFEGRNKKYGAYVLRVEYERTMVKSLLIVMTGAAAMALLAFLVNKPIAPAPDLTGQADPKIYEVPVQLPEPEPPRPQASSPAAPGTAENRAVVFRDSIVEQQVAQKDSIPGPAITSTIQGTAVSNSSTLSQASGSNQVLSTSTVASQLEVDQMPEFEGGLAGLRRFISANIKYPDGAREEQQNGVVHIKFVVDENGNVLTPVALNKPGYGFEEEALRVVAMIAKFKTPGKMKGHPVKVYYVLPIRFVMR
jgi:protein TonB